jgi:hypothetical protein
MSQQGQRAVPKWPVVNFNKVFAAIDPISVVVGLGGGLALFYIVQKFVLKRCIR